MLTYLAVIGLSPVVRSLQDGPKSLADEFVFPSYKFTASNTQFLASSKIKSLNLRIQLHI